MTQEFDGQLAALELACGKTTFPLGSEKPRNYSSKMSSWYAKLVWTNGIHPIAMNIIFVWIPIKHTSKINRKRFCTYAHDKMEE
ncbi:hypothetical protein CRE_22479 [Caenorhabditis remanei]|uniref:Uncharacterized protein n=1 Tax=Caenorhabditis remanei TaxID=31234 RepID=E3MDW3_CAERE|nr:hypothetical protein CRE_22479 [Caenorhabditis remanei]